MDLRPETRRVMQRFFGELRAGGAPENLIAEIEGAVACAIAREPARIIPFPLDRVKAAAAPKPGGARPRARRSPGPAR